MSTASVASSTPEPPEAIAAPAPEVDIANLDDKHLGQYRHPNERRALLAIVVGLAAIAVVIWLARPILGNVLGFLPNPILRFLSQWLDPTRLGLVLLGLLALMALMDIVGQSSRAMQLVARAVEVTPVTFPQFASIVDDLRTRFDLPRTRGYVSRDAPPNGYTIGVREPFAIVFSSIGVGSLTPAEFKFVLGCEMGSIKLGHTKMAVLLGNVNMSLPQPFSVLLKFRSVLFSTYHHAQALSCDRIGVVATRDVRPALSTLVKQNLGAVRGAKIDIKSLAPQTAELNRGVSGAVLRTSMVMNPQPFAVARLSELVAWAGEPAPTVTTTPAAPPPPTLAASAAALPTSSSARSSSKPAERPSTR
jgi:Zn-dependent protease with chaperone function